MLCQLIYVLFVLACLEASIEKCFERF